MIPCGGEASSGTRTAGNPQPGAGSATMHDERDRRAEFEHRVVAVMDRMYGTALRLTRNAADAEDLVADALIKGWARRDELRDPDCFAGWIMRVLANTYVSNWRHRRAELELTDPGVESGDAEADSAFLYTKLHQPFLLWWSTPEQTFVNELLRDDLAAALDALPDGYRVVVVLVEILGYSYAEAAQSLEVPVGTVRSRLNRGRRLLQEALWAHAQEAGIRSEDAPAENGE